MDHYNVTVQRDGALVATRRGMQVSKQKYHGISFVNASCPQSAPGARPPANGPPLDFSKPPQQQQRWRFVTKDKEPRRPTGKPRPNKPAKTSPPRAPVAPVPAPACKPESDEDEQQKRGQSRGGALAFYTVAADAGGLPPQLPVWASFRLPLVEKEQQLFHNFFNLVPKKMYPYEDILTYNPTRSRDFFWMVVQDEAAINCVLMCNSMFRSVLSGRTMSEELAYYVSKVCAIINRQLDGQPKKISSITLECITTLALMAVSLLRFRPPPFPTSDPTPFSHPPPPLLSSPPPPHPWIHCMWWLADDW